MGAEAFFLGENRVLNPQITIAIGRAVFAVTGVSTVAAGASAIILATGGAVLLVGSGIYLATRNNQINAPRLPKTTGMKLTPSPDTFSCRPLLKIRSIRSVKANDFR